METATETIFTKLGLGEACMCPLGSQVPPPLHERYKAPPPTHTTPFSITRSKTIECKHFSNNLLCLLQNFNV